MPISDIRCENGIYRCRGMARIEIQDAERWSQYARTFASLSAFPIIALINAMDTTYICAAARDILAQATGIPKIHKIVITTDHFVVGQNLQLILRMANRPNIVIFDELEQASAFAQQQANLLRQNGVRS